MAAQFDAALRTNLLFRGPSPYYPVGSLDVKRAGNVVFNVDVADPPLVGRLLHTESKAYLSGLAATRADPARQTVPLKQACGRYVDWYDGGTRHAGECAAGRGRPAAAADRARRLGSLRAASLGRHPGHSRHLPDRVHGDRDRQAQLSADAGAAPLPG